MSFNGTGTFVINSSGQPVVSGTVASATVFNAFAADLATGLSTCITKDGQTTPTNNIPMGGFKITGLGAGTVGGDAVRLSQLQAGTAQLLTVSGTDTLAALGTPAVTAYTTGNLFYFVAAATNTTSVTLNVDGLGARNMTRHGSVALVAGDILVGEVCIVVYDGTRFQLLNPGSYTNLNVSGVLSLAAGAVGTPSLAASGDLNTGLWFPAADTIAASVGGVEGWRLNSLGFGVGGVPVNRLDVVGDQNSSLTSRVVNINAGGSAGSRLRLENATAPWDISNSRANSSALTFEYNSTERMRLDSSGNLGIGTAGVTARGNLDVSSASLGGSQTRSIHLGYSGADFYGFRATNVNNASNTFAGTFSLQRGTGSAWVDDFVIDDSGNLGVGTSSPLDKLHVAGAMRQVFPSAFAGSGIVGAIDGVSNGFRVTNTAGNALTFTMQNGSNDLGFELDNSRNASIGAGSVATSATDGFLYVPTCAGTPTGTPTAKTGYAPIVVNTTNNKLYFYSSGVWRDAGP